MASGQGKMDCDADADVINKQWRSEKMKIDAELDGMEITLTKTAYCGNCLAQGSVQRNLFECTACKVNVALNALQKETTNIPTSEVFIQ